MIPADRIAAWLEAYAFQAGARGYIVGLSGGIDSATTAVLCKWAVGEHVLAVLMPCYSLPQDSELAHLVADAFDIRTLTVDLGPAYDILAAALPPEVSEIAKANIKPRLRMTTLYALAQTYGYLVAGTGNKSELAIGYFTKHGDGGVDVEPLGDLYKYQVRQLAEDLGIPRPIIDRPPSAGLWDGQTDEGEIGLSYSELDAALAAIEAERTGLQDPALFDSVRRMIDATHHKRAMPPVFRLDTSDGV
jgi:NAD+ synthase